MTYEKAQELFEEHFKNSWMHNLVNPPFSTTTVIQRFITEGYDPKTKTYTNNTRKWSDEINKEDMEYLIKYYPWFAKIIDNE